LAHDPEPEPTKLPAHHPLATAALATTPSESDEDGLKPFEKMNSLQKNQMIP
jgi:hypothetical protein